MKYRFFFFIFLLFINASSGLLAQEKFDVTGVWTGRIFNDSTRQFLPFELAISQKNGVLSGYSYTVFTIDSVENIGVKEITIKLQDGKYIIRDKKLIDNNYATKPAKGVYTTLELRQEDSDTADILSGIWFTNKTKLYYPLSGTAFLSRKKRIQESAIMPKLTALGLANSLSFVTVNHGYDDEVTVTRKRSDGKSDKDMITIVEPELVIEIPQKKDTAKSISLGDLKSLESLLDSVKPQTEKELLRGNSVSAETKKSDSVLSVAGKEPGDQKDKKDEKVTVGIAVKGAKPEELNQSEKTKGLPSEKSQAITKNQSGKKEIANLTEPPKDLANRRVETIRSVQLVGDSIVLSLFDNGTIDGDTVSVLLNGRVIVSKIGLLATAYNHTLHLTPDMGDSIKLILYAENLGSIPPNTGLLVIRDGNVNHEIRFSGDLKNNSAIILRRNKKE